MVATLSDAAADDPLLVAQTLFRSSKCGVELSKRAAADVAQLTAFQVVPDPFHWIEIRRVARQSLKMDPLGSPTGQEILDRLAAMDGGSIGR
jgi:hypothetical protein